LVAANADTVLIGIGDRADRVLKVIPRSRVEAINVPPRKPVGQTVRP
jgi:hypothetical protein